MRFKQNGIKTDQRTWPADRADYLANGNDPLYLPAPERLELATVPLPQDIFAQMRSKPRPR